MAGFTRPTKPLGRVGRVERSATRRLKDRQEIEG